MIFLNRSMIIMMTFVYFTTAVFSEEIITEVLPPIPAIEELEETGTDTLGENKVAVPVEEVSNNTTQADNAGTYTDGNLTGRVNASNLNIRSGPSSDRYEIVTTLKRDAEVVIFGESEGWFSIAYPPHHPCYIKASYIEEKVASSIPADGISVPVNGAKVPLHVRPWPKATVVGYLGNGDIVTLLGRRGSFYTISPPPVARAWVSKKYIAVDKNTESVPKVIAPTPGVVYGLTKKKNVIKKKGAIEPKPMHRLFSEFRKTAAKKNQLIKRKVNKPVVSPEIQIEKEMAEIEKELNKIKEKTARKKEKIRRELAAAKIAADESGVDLSIIKEPATNHAESNAGGFNEKAEYITGWVEFIGHGARRPAAFRLVKGGEVLFLLRSGKYNLRDYVNKRVEVDGDVQIAPGFQANVLVVTDIRIKGASPLSAKKQDIIKSDSYQQENTAEKDSGDIEIIDNYKLETNGNEYSADGEKSMIPVIAGSDLAGESEREETEIIKQNDIGKIISVE